MRMRIAERLKEAQNTNAMLTTFNEIDMRLLNIYYNYYCYHLGINAREIFSKILRTMFFRESYSYQ